MGEIGLFGESQKAIANVSHVNKKLMIYSKSGLKSPTSDIQNER